jgi:arsenate reductase
VDEFADETFDLVLTVCDDARETCPVFPRHTIRRHQNLSDPAAVEGSEAERLDAFRRVRDELRAYLRDW